MWLNTTWVCTKMARVSTHSHELIYDHLEFTNAYTDGHILNFLEEVDQGFDKDKLSVEDLQGLKETLQNKTSNINEDLTKDGEFTREVAILLHQRSGNNGQVDNY